MRGAGAAERCILVPVRGFSAALGKTRLSPALSPGERASLVSRMAERVVATAARVAPTFVLAREPPPAAVLARAADVIVDAGRGLNAELEAACDALLAGRYGRLLVLPGDVPLVGAQRLRAALGLLGRFDVVLAPSRDGGTALAGLRAPRRMRLCFGEAESCEAHRSAALAAGLSVRVQRRPLLDVDTADDVAALGWRF